MIEPILSLALSMQSNPGVYALLLGSGLSRSAGIPTGWEVVSDLIRRLAVLAGEDCEPNPDYWYQKKFGVAPEYSSVLNEICKSPAERQQLLRGYFEPTDEERAEGLKVPTAAHRSIARLVSQGYIRVIVTTNFDRLLEKAMEEVGVIPTVISSSDQIRGALPIIHTRCAIIKVNGDYLDTRLKNTIEELERYDDELNALLDRIFDEHGLLVAGWSSKWDLALRAAIDRCPNHRFTTFWCHRRNIDEDAKGIIDRRRGIRIEIAEADTFFSNLGDKIDSLDAFNRPHPLSAPVAIATLKRYLSDDRARIQVRDFVADEALRLKDQVSDDQFPVSVEEATFDDVIGRMKRLEALTDTLGAIMVTGCYWGDSDHEYIWTDCLERIADHDTLASGSQEYLNLRKYPALLLLYAGGIAAVAARRYGNLAALLVRAKGESRSFEREEPLSFLMNPDTILRSGVAQKLVSPNEKNYTPINDYLFQIMREGLRNILPRDSQFENCFDAFEYLYVLSYIDFREEMKTSRRWVVGRFLWSDQKHYDFKETVRERLYAEMANLGEDWLGLRAGFFGGSLERLKRAQAELDAAIPRLRQSIGIW